MTGPADAWLRRTLADGLRAAVEGMTGSAPSVEWAPAQSPADPLVWSQPITVAPGAKLEVSAAAADWQTLGGWVLRAAGLDEDEETQRDTWREVLGQALGTVSQALTASIGREIFCIDGAFASQAKEQPWATLVVTMDSQAARLHIGIAEPLWRAIPASASAAPVPAPLPAPLARSEASPLGGFDLLLDVELKVSVSFGRAELPLRDVIKLSSGSIVELNRAVSEPVEVIVNNCVVARGEVVVVEGNYGVRIHQIVSRQERLRTLR